MNEQETIAKAKGHIRLAEYEKARALLETIPQNSIAIQLLFRIDAIQRKRAGKPAPKVSPMIIREKETGCLAGIPRLALGIIVVSMAFWTTALSAYAFMSPQIQSNALVISLGLVFLMLFILFLYWLFYRFFWWALAISWGIGTLLAVGAFFAGVGR